MFKALFRQLRVKKEVVTENVKYQNSGLNKELADELNQRLLELMIHDKLYRDSELNLEKLAKHLETNRHNTSQIINQYHKKSYSEFINDFRIDDAKEIILRYKNININKLVFDLGFNSKSNFYEAFKRRTNLTPTQFKINHSDEPSNAIHLI